MATGTQTTTFTVVDIRRVVENFAADFAMIGTATGLRTRDEVASTVQDLGLFAELGYLVEISRCSWKLQPEPNREPLSMLYPNPLLRG